MAQYPAPPTYQGVDPMMLYYMLMAAQEQSKKQQGQGGANNAAKGVLGGAGGGYATASAAGPSATAQEIAALNAAGYEAPMVAGPGMEGTGFVGAEGIGGGGAGGVPSSSIASFGSYAVPAAAVILTAYGLARSKDNPSNKEPQRWKNLKKWGYKYTPEGADAWTHNNTVPNPTGADFERAAVPAEIFGNAWMEDFSPEERAALTTGAFTNEKHGGYYFDRKKLREEGDRILRSKGKGETGAARTAEVRRLQAMDPDQHLFNIDAGFEAGSEPTQTDYYDLMRRAVGGSGQRKGSLAGFFQGQQPAGSQGGGISLGGGGGNFQIPRLPNLNIPAQEADPGRYTREVTPEMQDRLQQIYQQGGFNPWRTL